MTSSGISPMGTSHFPVPPLERRPTSPPVQSKEAWGICEAMCETSLQVIAFLTHNVAERIFEFFSNNLSQIFIGLALCTWCFGIAVGITGVVLFEAAYGLYCAITFVVALAFALLAVGFADEADFTETEKNRGHNSSMAPEASAPSWWYSSSDANEPDPPFVEGDPVKLPNHGATCFINVKIQELMNEPLLRAPIVETIREKRAEFAVIDKLIAGGINQQGAMPLTANEIMLLVSFLSSEEITKQWYDSVIGSRAQNEAELKVLDTTVEKFRKASVFCDPIPELSEETTEQILLALKTLFDARTLALFTEMKREQADHIYLLDLFLNSVDAYQSSKTGKIEGKSLDDLRYLLAGACPKLNVGRYQGYQASDEFIDKLLRMVDPRKHPELFVRLTTHRHYQRYDLSQDPPSLRQEREEVLKKKRDPTRLLSDGSVETKELGLLSRTLELPLPRPDAPLMYDGQQLVEAQFEWHPPSEVGDPATYANAEGNLEYYLQDQEKISFEQNPSHLRINLKRFYKTGRNNTLRQYKQDHPVYMPEFLKRGESYYELTSVTQHLGDRIEGGHYIQFSKKENGWWLLNDDKIKHLGHLSQPENPQCAIQQRLLGEALALGVSYFYRLCEAPKDPLIPKEEGFRIVQEYTQQKRRHVSFEETPESKEDLEALDKASSSSQASNSTVSLIQQPPSAGDEQESL